MSIELGIYERKDSCDKADRAPGATPTMGSISKGHHHPMPVMK